MARTPEAGSARFCRPEAYTTNASKWPNSGRGPEAKPEKFAAPELSKVGLAAKTRPPHLPNLHPAHPPPAY